MNDFKLPALPALDVMLVVHETCTTEQYIHLVYYIILVTTDPHNKRKMPVVNRERITLLLI